MRKQIYMRTLQSRKKEKRDRETNGKKRRRENSGIKTREERDDGEQGLIVVQIACFIANCFLGLEEAAVPHRQIQLVLLPS